MRMVRNRLGVALFVLLLAGCTHTQSQDASIQPIIDLHRHAPWPGESDDDAVGVIRQTLRTHNVVATALFITGREDISQYRSDKDVRFLLSPMLPCPELTAQRKWCAVDSVGPMPDSVWLEQQLANGSLEGIGELVFNYAGIAPDDPVMSSYWSMAARHDAIAFVHSGRGPANGQGPRRHAGCCKAYRADYGNPSLLRPVLQRHPRLRMVVQHAGFDYMSETLSLLRDFPNVFVEISVLNSVGPRALHDSSLQTLVSSGFGDRIVLGSDDLDYAPIIERIEGAAFLSPAQRRAIYYDNAARLLRLDRATIAGDYGR